MSIDSNKMLINEFPVVPSQKTSSAFFDNGKADKRAFSVLSDSERYLLETSKIIQNIHGDQELPTVSNQAVISKPVGSLEELLFDACAKVKIATSQVSMHIRGDWREKLFRQLDLIHDIDDWDSEDNPIDEGSFKNFLRWYLYEKPNRSPGIGLSSSGNVVIAWMKAKDRLTIEFEPSGFVSWTVTKFFNGDAERGAGRTSLKRLSTILRPYEPEHFFM